MIVARHPRAAVASAPLLLAVLALLATACGRGDESDGGEATPVVGVRIAPVTAQPFTETVGSIGSVTVRAGHVAALGAPAPTRVARVYVTTGEHVSRGQPLVTLEQAGFQAGAQSAEAQLAAAQAAYDRAKRLVDAGIAPRKELDQATADLAAARANAVNARRAAELSVLRSPIDGVVTKMTATLGASVDANQPLVEVADPHALDILFGVTPAEAARVHPGDEVQLTAGPSAGGEPLGVGAVTDVAGTVDTATRTVAVRVHATTTRRPLRIGETVFGRIAVATVPNATTIPAQALVPEGEGFKVFVVDANGVAHEQPVTVGARTDSLVEISSGLRPGQRVVTYGAYGVQDSARVRELPR